MMAQVRHDEDNRGWIALYRKFREHRFWKEHRTFSRAEAWLDILMSARWKMEPKQIILGNKVIVCKRGQVCYSIGTWAARWNWSRSAIQRYFVLLKNARQIDTENVTKTIRITVCNYDLYQQDRIGNESEVNRLRIGSESVSDTTEQEKKETREEEKSAREPPFGGFRLPPADPSAHWQKLDRLICDWNNETNGDGVAANPYLLVPTQRQVGEHLIQRGVELADLSRETIKTSVELWRSKIVKDSTRRQSGWQVWHIADAIAARNAPEADEEEDLGQQNARLRKERENAAT